MLKNCMLFFPILSAMAVFAAEPIPLSLASSPLDSTVSLSPQKAAVAIDSSRNTSVKGTYDSTKSAETTTANFPAVDSLAKAPEAPVVDTVTPILLPAKKSVLRRLPQVAILAFTGDELSSKELNAVTNRFETELLATDSFKIIERRNIDKILKEQGFQQSGACDNSECSVEIGQLLSVQGIFTGDLSRVGKIWSLSVKKTNVGSGQTEFSHVLDIQGSLEDVLRGGCAEMALIASGKKKAEENRTVLVAKGGSIWPWVLGGLAVAGGATAAVILLTQDKTTNQGTTVGSHDVTFSFETGK